MRNAILLPLTLCAAFLVAPAASAAPAASPAPAASRPGKSSLFDRAHRIIVKLKDDAGGKARAMSAGRVDRLGAAAREKLTFRRSLSGRAHLLALPRTMTLSEAEAVARRVAADPEVEYAEPDARMRPAAAPNDFYYVTSPLQWHYYSSAGEIGSASLPLAWDVTTGNATLVVAVVDTGLLFTHPDVPAGRLVSGWDFVSEDDPGKYYSANDGNGRDSNPADPGDWITAGEDAGTEAEGYLAGCGQSNSSWHGSHTFGTVGAATNNGTGVAGVNWASKMLPVRVLGKCGGYLSDIADGIRWAAGVHVDGATDNANPAKVVNVSIEGSGACGATYQNAVNDAVGAGAIVVVAAGNHSQDAANWRPGNCSNVITVAAVNRDGNLASYSNYGASVEIAAPGGDSPLNPDGVLSLGNAGATSPAAHGYYYNAGTSMAAPHVAGIVSLMLSADSTLTQAEVLSKLQLYARSFPGGSTCDTSICGAGIADGGLALRPLPPANIAITGFSQTQLSWSWSSRPDVVSWDVYAQPGGFIQNVGTPAITRTVGSNVYTGIRVVAKNAAGDSSVSIGPSTATYSAASSFTQVIPHASSITVRFATVAGGSGYRLDASLNAGFTGTLVSSATANPNSSELQIVGLSPLTGYYVRIAVLNQLGAQTLTDYGSLVTTETDLFVPGEAPFSDLGTGQIRMNWTQGLNNPGQTYKAEAAADPGFSGTVSSATGVDLFTALFTGLQVNTSYYFRVRPLGGPYWSTGPVVTYALSPAQTSPAYPAVSASGLTLAWSPNGNTSGTVYQAQVCTDPGFTNPVPVSSVTRNADAAFTGLTPNTLYYARVRAINHGGVPAPASGFVLLPSTATQAVAVSPVAPFFSGVSSGSLAGVFNSGTNPAGTAYVAQLSVAPDFSVINYQRGGVMAAGDNVAGFGGLQPNRRHYFQVAAVNQLGNATAFTPAAQSTATFPAQPAASAEAHAVHSTSITFRWADNANMAGTQYDARFDDEPGFNAPVVFSETTLADARASTPTALSQNTVYYAQVRARRLDANNPHSAYADLAARSTRSKPALVDPGGSFPIVAYTSVTVRWTPRPPAPQADTCEGYLVELALAGDFSGSLYAKAVNGSDKSSATVSGLRASTTYYARVATLNWDGLATYTPLGSTRTMVPLISSGVITGGSASFNVVPMFPELTRISVDVPAKAFAVGTVVEINSSVEMDLPPVGRDQPTLSLLNPWVGFSLSASGLQPQRVVPITLTYQVPLGVDQDLLGMGRYDEMSRRWVLLPTTVDKGLKSMTAITDHFSFFAPLIVQPGSNLSEVEVYPIPWEPDSTDLLHGGAHLTVARLPRDARVRIFTILGELIDDARAAPNGVLFWDGLNTRGGKAGTGTYIMAIDAPVGQTNKRFVLIR